MLFFLEGEHFNDAQNCQGGGDNVPVDDENKELETHNKTKEMVRQHLFFFFLNHRHLDN